MACPRASGGREMKVEVEVEEGVEVD